jgi:hypothetical protein
MARRWTFFGGSAGGVHPYVDTAQITNFYLENVQTQGKGEVVAYSWPGYGAPYISGLAGTIRSLYTLNNLLYVVAGNSFYVIAPPNNVATVLGTLSTNNGQVSITDNAVQIFLTDGLAGYIYNTQTAVFTKISDANFPPLPTGAAYQDGYFLVGKGNSRQFFVSAQYDGTTWTPVSFASKEQFTDNLVSIFASGGLIRLFGSNSIEFWTSSGSLDFPFIRSQGVTTYLGVLAPASIDQVEDNFFFLGTNFNGDMRVYWLKNTSVNSISSPQLNRQLNTYSKVTDAIGQAMQMDEHIFYILTFPTQGVTWVYDLTMSQFLEQPVWCNLSSAGMPYYRISQVTSLTGNIYLGDSIAGNIYSLSKELATENSAAVQRQLVSAHIYDNGERVYVNELQLAMEVGSKNVQGPKLLFELSKDGGFTYLPGQLLSLGGIGKYTTRVRALRLGRMRDGVIRLTLNDPVYMALLGAEVN